MSPLKPPRRHGPPMLVRPADALLPLALLIASLLGHWDAAKSLYKYALFARALALGSAVGLRIALSAQPSMRLARGSARLALLLQLAGGALAAAGLAATGQLHPASPCLIGAGVGLNVEAVCYEYLYAAGEGRSAAMLHAITSALTLGATLMTTPGQPPRYQLFAAILSAAVGLTVAVTIAEGLGKFKYSDTLLCAAPRALLYCGLYPLSWMLLRRAPGLWVAKCPTFTPFFAGLIPWLLWRTPYRRSALESRPMLRAAAATLCACAVTLAACATPTLAPLTPTLPAAAIMVAVATLCALAVFVGIEKP